MAPRRRFATPAIFALAATLVAVPALAITVHGAFPNNPGVRVTAPYFSWDAAVRLTAISTDTFTNSDSQHATEVEPDTFAWGNTEVSVFQMGRFNTGGGASDIGWSTSTDGGKTWQHGAFKGLTRIENPSNPYDRVSDPSIAYDAKHGKWIAAVLPINNETGQEPNVLTSTDGLTWAKPVRIAADNGDFIDKSWIACDNTSSSPFYGHCYIEDDDASLGDQEMMSTTKDGGMTWAKPFTVANAFGLGGQPLAEPNGTVVVPFVSVVDGTISAFRSTNGGTSFGNTVAVATINYNPQGGSLRSSVLPSAEMDGAGNIYVAWPDCSFRQNCTNDDIVYATSPDGNAWSHVKRVPIDPLISKVDHFIPGIAIDPATAGASAHVALTYYYYPNGACSICKLHVGYIHSNNGGATWTRFKSLTGAMNTTWMALTDQGYMVGDYISTLHVNGKVHAAFAVATAPNGSDFNEFTATTAAGLVGLDERFQVTSRGERPISRRPYHVPFIPAD